ALRLDRRVVHENVVAAVLLRDEAQTLLGVEPLHGALSHCSLLLYGARGRHFDDPAIDAVTRRSHPGLAPTRRNAVGSQTPRASDLLELAPVALDRLPSIGPMPRSGDRKYSGP